MNVPGLAVVVFFAVSSLGFELTLDPDELVSRTFIYCSRPKQLALREAITNQSKK